MFVFSHWHREKSTESVDSGKSEVSSLSVYTFFKIANFPNVTVELMVEIHIIDAKAKVALPFWRKCRMRCLLDWNLLAVFIAVNHSCIHW